MKSIHPAEVAGGKNETWGQLPGTSGWRLHIVKSTGLDSVTHCGRRVPVSSFRGCPVPEIKSVRACPECVKARQAEGGAA